MTFFLRQLRIFLIGVLIALSSFPTALWCISHQLPFEGCAALSSSDIHFACHHGTITAVTIPHARKLLLPDNTTTDLLDIAPTSPLAFRFPYYHRVDVNLLSRAHPNHPYIHLPFWIVVLPLVSLAVTFSALSIRRAVRSHVPPLRAVTASMLFVRWTLTLVSASTLALLMISTSFTARGTWVFASGPSNPAHVIWSSSLSAGAVSVSRKTDPFGLLDVLTLVVLNYRDDRERLRWLPNYVSDTSNPRQTNRTLTLPLYIPFLLTALPAAFLWRSAYRHHRRTLTNACLRCNYSLTGLPLNTRCPECGTAPFNPACASPR